MTYRNYHKLGSSVTDPELQNLCYEILYPSKVGMTATMLSERLLTLYGKDIHCRRVSSNLRTDKRFKCRKVMNKWNTAKILEWDVW